MENAQRRNSPVSVAHGEQQALPNKPQQESRHRRLSLSSHAANGGDWTSSFVMTPYESSPHLETKPNVAAVAKTKHSTVNNKRRTSLASSPIKAGDAAQHTRTISLRSMDDDSNSCTSITNDSLPVPPQQQIANNNTESTAVRRLPNGSVQQPRRRSFVEGSNNNNNNNNHSRNHEAPAVRRLSNGSTQQSKRRPASVQAVSYMNNHREYSLHLKKASDRPERRRSSVQGSSLTVMPPAPPFSPKQRRGSLVNGVWTPEFETPDFSADTSSPVRQQQSASAIAMTRRSSKSPPRHRSSLTGTNPRDIYFQPKTSDDASQRSCRRSSLSSLDPAAALSPRPTRRQSMSSIGSSTMDNDSSRRGRRSLLLNGLVSPRTTPKKKVLMELPVTLSAASTVTRRRSLGRGDDSVAAKDVSGRSNRTSLSVQSSLALPKASPMKRKQQLRDIKVPSLFSSTSPPRRRESTSSKDASGRSNRTSVSYQPTSTGSSSSLLTSPKTPTKKKLMELPNLLSTNHPLPKRPTEAPPKDADASGRSNRSSVSYGSMNSSSSVSVEVFASPNSLGKKLRDMPSLLYKSPAQRRQGSKGIPSRADSAGRGRRQRSLSPDKRNLPSNGSASSPIRSTRKMLERLPDLLYKSPPRRRPTDGSDVRSGSCGRGDRRRSLSPGKKNYMPMKSGHSATPKGESKASQKFSTEEKQTSRKAHDEILQFPTRQMKPPSRRRLMESSGLGTSVHMPHNGGRSPMRPRRIGPTALSESAHNPRHQFRRSNSAPSLSRKASVKTHEKTLSALDRKVSTESNDFQDPFTDLPVKTTSPKRPSKSEFSSSSHHSFRGTSSGRASTRRFNRSNSDVELRRKNSSLHSSMPNLESLGRPASPVKSLKSSPAVSRPRPTERRQGEIQEMEDWMHRHERSISSGGKAMKTKKSIQRQPNRSSWSTGRASTRRKGSDKSELRPLKEFNKESSFSRRSNQSPLKPGRIVMTRQGSESRLHQRPSKKLSGGHQSVSQPKPLRRTQTPEPKRLYS